MKDSFDEDIMRKAIALGDTSRSLAPPNPWVGCVIVKNGTIVGQGATQKAGGLHAETTALNEAGSQSKGATLYVTLEPCCHHGRTPPCVEAIKKSGISRVVIALKDPDEKVNGKGIQHLLELGIEVHQGICEKEAELSLKPYLFQRKSKSPYLIAKCACSLDGRLAAEDGSSKWLSSELARKDAQELRRQSQAILIGAGTAAKDLPRLTVREANNQPLRVVLDSKGRLAANGPLFDSIAPTLIFTTQASDKKIHEWQALGARVEKISSNDSGVNLREVLRNLYEKGIIQVLCEGGGILLGSLLKENLINRLIAYVSPCLLGDKGKPMFEHLTIANVQQSKKLFLLDSKVLDGTIRVDYNI